ncbi:MAG: hypothetical protein WA125_18165, partial [Desulfosporosinus sp.]
MPKKLSTREKNDIMYVMKKGETGKTNVLDLTDDIQHRFYLRQLELAGITEQKRPYLYQSIDGLRQKQQQYKQYKQFLQYFLNAASSVQDTSVNVVTELSTLDGQAFSASAVSSVPNGTVMTLVTIGMYDSNFDPIGPVGSTQQFNQGVCAVAETKGSFGTPMPSEGREINAIATYNYVNSSGQTISNTAVTTYKFPQKITISAPVISDANKKAPTHTKIKLCMNRADNDCDYNYTQGTTGPYTVVLPFQGEIDYFDPIDQIVYDKDGNALNASCTISVAATGQGGTAVTPPTDYNFFKDKSTVINGKSITWNVPWLRFDNTEAKAPIYSTGQDMYFIFQLNVPVKAQTIVAFITNAPSEMT